ncbi:single-stranded DNA-binding protein [Vallitaleaceae bacterium 9-2]
MNKVILMGRLTRDPEVRYSQGAEPLAIARYSLAVNRRFKRDGEPDADFINIVAFGRNAEFAEKFFQKGQQVSVVGHIQTGSYEKDGVRRYTTDIVVEEQHFAESKRSFEERMGGQSSNNSYNEAPMSKPQSNGNVDGFVSVDDDFDDDDIPF